MASVPKPPAAPAAAGPAPSLSPSSAAQPGRVRSAGHVRYGILALIVFVTVINYADRSTISMAGVDMTRELLLDPAQLGIVFSAFGWAYAIGQLPGGWMLDRFGARRVYGASILLWSLFTFLQGTVGWLGMSGAAAVGALFFMRFMLGLVESPAFPANSRIVSAWFPTVERGMASSLFNSAQYLAVVIFTPFMGWLIHALGWEHVFLWMGGAGMVVGVAWFFLYRDPMTHPRLRADELALMRDGGALVDLDQARIAAGGKRVTWRQAKVLVQNRTLWGIYLGQYCITSLTYFFITWFPIYLIKARGMSVMTAGWVATLPAICGFTGGVLGGLLSDFMIRRGGHPSTARKTPFVMGMVLATLLVLANYVQTDTAVVALMATAFFGKGLAAVGWAVMSDTAPKTMIGLSGGVFNGVGNIAGIVTPLVIGYVVAATGSFSLALWFVGAHGVLGILAYLVLAKRFERIEAPA